MTTAFETGGIDLFQLPPFETTTRLASPFPPLMPSLSLLYNSAEALSKHWLKEDPINMSLWNAYAQLHVQSGQPKIVSHYRPLATIHSYTSGMLIKWPH
jgi:hypothetical protein